MTCARKLCRRSGHLRCDQLVWCGAALQTAVSELVCFKQCLKQFCLPWLLYAMGSEQMYDGKRMFYSCAVVSYAAASAVTLPTTLARPAGYSATQLFGQGVSYTYDDVIMHPGHICFGAHEVMRPGRVCRQSSWQAAAPAADILVLAMPALTRAAVGWCRWT
jgi:hypothetical protein